MEVFGGFILIMVLSIAYGSYIGKRSAIHTILRDGYFDDNGERYTVKRFVSTQITAEEADKKIMKTIKNW